MAEILYERPASAVWTVAEAKQHLKVDHNDEDVLISSYIEAATIWAQDLTLRSLISQKWRLTAPTFPAHYRESVRLARGPVSAIDTVKYFDISGVQQTWDSASYQVTTWNDSLSLLYPASGESWPDTDDDNANAIEIIYTAGYGASRDDVPEDIRVAILYRIADLYELRGQSDTAQTSRAYDPALTDSLLMHYRLGCA